jgi:hypothetical protein
MRKELRYNACNLLLLQMWSSTNNVPVFLPVQVPLRIWRSELSLSGWTLRYFKTPRIVGFEHRALILCRLVHLTWLNESNDH